MFVRSYRHTDSSSFLLIHSKVSGVYKKDGTLWTIIPGEPDLKLLPESSTKFFSSNKEYDWQIEFKTDSAGNVLKAYFIFSGLKKEAKKL